MKAWLKCSVQPGMFSHEVIARFTLSDGSFSSYFVDLREVRGEQVRVDVIDHQGTKWAILPTDHPYHPIPIREGDLEPVGQETATA